MAKKKTSKKTVKKSFNLKLDREIKDIWFYAALAIILLVGVIILA